MKNCEGHSLQLVHALAGVDIDAIRGADEHINTDGRAELNSMNEGPNKSTEQNLLEPAAIAYHTCS